MPNAETIVAAALSGIANAALASTMLAPFRRIRGTYKQGNYRERTGAILATFIKNGGAGIEHVRYWEKDGTFGCLIVRNRWESWAGHMTAAQWAALRAYLPAAVAYLPL